MVRIIDMLAQYQQVLKSHLVAVLGEFRVSAITESRIQAVAMMDLHEGRIPFYQARTAEEFEEAKRLFYVGVTRARQILLYVTDNSNPRNRPSRFLREGGVCVC